MSRSAATTGRDAVLGVLTAQLARRPDGAFIVRSAEPLPPYADRRALRRLAEVEDIANMAAYLIGDTGRNITGTVMTVDAGSTA